MIRFTSHSGIYTLEARQKVPIHTEDAWAFLSSPENLQRITPPHMGFRITSDLGNRTMYPGQIITYKVSPFPGITTNWVTEITHVTKGRYFVDEQRFGPYRLWHHKHFITPIEGGTEMVDIVSYKLPMGFLGRWMHRLVVKRQLKKIFEYRYKAVVALFGEYTPSVLVKV
jgi:ligand-binding SRPBCC domain-containing protein